MNASLPSRPSWRPTFLRRSLTGARRVSPVDSTRPVSVPPLPPRRREPSKPEEDGPCCLRPLVTGSASGPCLSRGYLCVHFRCGPVTRSPPQRWLRRRASVHSVSLLAAVQATGLPALAQAGLSPTERASLPWPYHQTKSARKVPSEGCLHQLRRTPTGVLLHPVWRR